MLKFITLYKARREAVFTARPSLDTEIYESIGRFAHCNRKEVLSYCFLFALPTERYFHSTKFMIVSRLYRRREFKVRRKRSNEFHTRRWYFHENMTCG